MALNFPEKNNDEKVLLAPGVEFQWLHTGDAYYINLQDTSPKAVNSFVSANVAQANRWNSDKPWVAIQHITGDEITITPYIEGRLNDLVSAVGALPLSGYVVFVSSPENKLEDVIARLEAADELVSVEIETFNDLETARQRVREFIGEQS